MVARRAFALTGLLLALVIAGGFPRFAHAGYTSYLKLEGVDGEANPPGLDKATHVLSVTLGQHAFGETQRDDSTSSTLQQDLLGGTSISQATIAFYKNDPNTASEPYETILFHDVIVNSIMTTTLNAQPAEHVSFQFASPATYYYLALPGPGVIPIDSLTITDNVFSVHRAVDASSPALAAAFANGVDFSSASLLVFTNSAAGTPPDFSIVFDQALISSIVGDGSGADLGETISFAAADANVVPEPAVALLLVLGAAAGLTVRRLLERDLFEVDR
jgi:type VI protein secretion system component Hcp